MSIEYTILWRLPSFVDFSFDISDKAGSPIGFCKQKHLKHGDDIRVYNDKTRQNERLVIKARQVSEFHGYEVYESTTGEKLGALKRRDWLSMIHESWIVMDANDQEVGKITAKSMKLTTLRHSVSLVVHLFSQFMLGDGPGTGTLQHTTGRTGIIPDSCHMVDQNDREIATFHDNSLLNVAPDLIETKQTVVVKDDCTLPPLLVLSGGILSYLYARGLQNKGMMRAD